MTLGGPLGTLYVNGLAGFSLVQLYMCSYLPTVWPELIPRVLVGFQETSASSLHMQLVTGSVSLLTTCLGLTKSKASPDSRGRKRDAATF